MPTIAEVKLTHLIASATASLTTATTNAEVATAASDTAYATIEAAVAAAGHSSFEIGANSVTTPARLRAWSAEQGISPPRREDVGLSTLVATWRSASATTVRRQNELAGLRYVLDEAKGLAAAYPPVAEPDILPDLQSMLAAIQTSMAVL